MAEPLEAFQDKECHRSGDYLFVLEDGKFSHVIPPPLYPVLATDEANLCFLDHNDEKWDPRVEQCCFREGGHVHAHVHHGDTVEDILLEKCMDEAGCAIPMPWDLPIACFSPVSYDLNHQHGEGCGHDQIAHGDHLDWLVPLKDGSYMLSHACVSTNGLSEVIGHGRLVKVGKTLGKLQACSKQMLDLFWYESPIKKCYEILPQVENMVKDFDQDIMDRAKLKDEDYHLVSLQEDEKSMLNDDATKVMIQEDITSCGVQRTTLDVLGICCPAEVPLIKKILGPLPGVKEIQVNVPTKTVIVLHDPLLFSDVQLVKTLNEAKLDASIHRRGEWKENQKRLSPFTIGSGVLVCIALFHYIYAPLQWVALGAVAVGIPPIILRSYVSLRRFALDINVLMLIAIVGAIALGDYLEAGSIVFLFTLADWMESRSSDKARFAITKVMNLAPQSAILADSGLTVPIAEVKLGTRIAVKAGELVPIDGIVVSGSCTIDENSITGESIPVEKRLEARVWAGTLNLSGYVTIETTVLAKDSAVARMVRLVEEAQAQKSRAEKLVERFAKYYTPIVVLAAICFATIPLAFHVRNYRHWVYLALVLLVAACPCALVISTPVTTTCGIARAAQTGLVIKGGGFLETLGNLKVMAMDKTGTLTEGLFKVTDLQIADDKVDLLQLLRWVSIIESKSSHPIALALISYARHYVSDCFAEVEDFQILPGEGVHGRVDGHQIHIGNARLANRLGWIQDKYVMKIEAMNQNGATVCWVGVDEYLAAIVSVQDQVRPEAAEAIVQLKKLGLHIVMLTGDSAAAANCVKNQVGLTDVHYELLPENKVELVRGLKKEKGVVAMVGDGINDAPALAAADVGIAMGVAGSAIAMETANISLMTNDLRKLARAVDLGRRTRTKIIQNLVVSIGSKALIIALAASGYASLWAAIVADVGACLLVTFNGLLLLETAFIKEKLCCGKFPLKRDGKGSSNVNCCASKTCRGPTKTPLNVDELGVGIHTQVKSYCEGVGIRRRCGQKEICANSSNHEVSDLTDSQQGECCSTHSQVVVAVNEICCTKETPCQYNKKPDIEQGLLPKTPKSETNTCGKKCCENGNHPFINKMKKAGGGGECISCNGSTKAPLNVDDLEVGGRGIHTHVKSHCEGVGIRRRCGQKEICTDSGNHEGLDSTDSHQGECCSTNSHVAVMVNELCCTNKTPCQYNKKPDIDQGLVAKSPKNETGICGKRCCENGNRPFISKMKQRGEGECTGFTSDGDSSELLKTSVRNKALPGQLKKSCYDEKKQVNEGISENFSECKMGITHQHNHGSVKEHPHFNEEEEEKEQEEKEEEKKCCSHGC